MIKVKPGTIQQRYAQAMILLDRYILALDICKTELYAGWRLNLEPNEADQRITECSADIKSVLEGTHESQNKEIKELEDALEKAKAKHAQKREAGKSQALCAPYGQETSKFKPRYEGYEWAKWPPGDAISQTQTVPRSKDAYEIKGLSPRKAKKKTHKRKSV